ncbi:MAG TPA: DUF222 domain-containing protein, partial [Longimicrobiales bacterium]|nr:DUF222 domain-containing protein [Longimicrobiales bacterium]
MKRPGPVDPPPMAARVDLRFSPLHLLRPDLSHLHLVVREGGPEEGYGKAARVADEQAAVAAPVGSSGGAEQGGHGEIPDPFQDADALEELEEQIVVLASHIHAAEHRLLLLIAEFDRRGGWKLAGHRNCGEWLHFRTGIARGAARERVRVARALEKLPLTSEAMSRGELSFSKVRAISRLADDLSESENPEAEAEVVEVAKQVTAASLEKVVRGWKFMSGLDEVELERRRHRSRYLSVAPDGEGMYVVRGKLDPEAGALLMRTLEAAGKALYRKGEDWAAEGGPRGPQAEEITPRQRRADAIGLVCQRALAAGFGRGVDDADDEGGDGEPEENDAPISG